MRRSLTHYWRPHLAVVLGAAVTTAVLTGALVVGDSLRGSLRDLTLDRLGTIDWALVGERPFRPSLAADISTALGGKAPARLLTLRAGATVAESGARASEGPNSSTSFSPFFSLANGPLAARARPRGTC